VHSTVLRLTMAPRFDELQVAPDEFLPFIRSCFSAKTQGALEEPPQRRFRRAGHRSGA